MSEEGARRGLQNTDSVGSVTEGVAILTKKQESRSDRPAMVPHAVWDLYIDAIRRKSISKPIKTGVNLESELLRQMRFQQHGASRVSELLDESLWRLIWPSVVRWWVLGRHNILNDEKPCFVACLLIHKVEAESTHAVTGLVFSKSLVDAQALKELRLVSDAIYWDHCSASVQKVEEVVGTTEW